MPGNHQKGRTRNYQKTIVIWILIGRQLSGDKVTSGEKVIRKSERKGVTQPYIWHMAPNNLIICTSDKLLLSITTHQWSQLNLLKKQSVLFNSRANIFKSGDSGNCHFMN